MFGKLRRRVERLERLVENEVRSASYNTVDVKLYREKNAALEASVEELTAGKEMGLLESSHLRQERNRLRAEATGLRGRIKELEGRLKICEDASVLDRKNESLQSKLAAEQKKLAEAHKKLAAAMVATAATLRGLTEDDPAPPDNSMSRRPPADG